MLAAVVSILPWAFGALGIGLLGILGWRIGMPMIRIAELEQRVKLMETQLLTAKERYEAAEAREQRCISQLEQATLDLKKADVRIAAFLTVLELKEGAKQTLKGMI